MGRPIGGAGRTLVSVAGNGPLASDDVSTEFLRRTSIGSVHLGQMILMN